MNMPSYKGMLLDADGTSPKLARTAVKRITNNAAPNGFPHFVFAALRETSTIMASTIRTYTGFSKKFILKGVDEQT